MHIRAVRVDIHALAELAVVVDHAGVLVEVAMTAAHKDVAAPEEVLVEHLAEEDNRFLVV